MQLHEWYYFLNSIFKPLHLFFLNTFLCLRPCLSDSSQHYLGCLMLKQSNNSLEPVLSHFSYSLVLFTLSNTLLQRWESVRWTIFHFRCRARVSFSHSYSLVHLALRLGQQEEVLKKRKSRKYQQELEHRGKTELMELKGKGHGISKRQV